MPWNVTKSDQCPASKPWAVTKQGESEPVACHATEEAARRQMAALYANEPGEGGRSAQFSNALEKRSFGASGLEVRDAEQRIIGGPVVPYGTETRVGGYTESFASGAFKDTEGAGVPLLVAHRHASLPVGRTLTLSDTPAALTGEWQLSATRDADEVLSLARDGVPLGLSVGFAPIDDKWNKDRTKVIRVRAMLGEISVVGLPAYRDAKVVSVRAGGVNALKRSRLTIARLTRP